MTDPHRPEDPDKHDSDKHDPDMHDPDMHAPDKPLPRDIDPFRWPFSRRKDRPQRPSRRQRIADEIAANRRGEYTVPTWVLGLGLALMLAVICGFLLFY